VRRFRMGRDQSGAAIPARIWIGSYGQRRQLSRKRDCARV